MNTTPSALGRLLAPRSPDEFFHHNWERTVCVLHPGADVCDDVVTESDLDALLTRNDLRFPTINLVKDGQQIPTSQYSSVLRYGPYASEGLIDADFVYRQLHGGATVVCQLLQQSVRRTAQFISALVAQLGFRVDAHAFITPKNSQGLSTHYDTTSSFILQISGRKTWRLYEPIVDLPLVGQRFDENDGTTFTLTDEIVLERGDLLYVPRGIPHNPYTLDAHSIHVTLALFTPSWIDFLQRGLADCAHEELFRRAPRTTEDWSPALQEQLFEKIAAAVLANVRRHRVWEV
jgi:ribosomal protein L16 Arg81 hydroxylase